MLGKGGELALSLVPQVLALAAFVCRAYTSGAMDYGSVICVGPLALVMIVGMVGGWFLVGKAAKRIKRAPGSAEPLSAG